MNKEFYAHTDPASGGDVSRWEPLFTASCPALSGDECPECESLERFHGHLNKVAWWTAKFAAAMFPAGSEDAKAAWKWGYIAGLWHDLGKFAHLFQRKLLGERIQVEHAGAGAALARQTVPRGWDVLAFVIAGHHCGLANRAARETIADKLTSLDERLDRASVALDECRWTIARDTPFTFESFARSQHPLLPPPVQSAGPELPFAYGTFVRMLFSALVDADSVATEKFCFPDDQKTLFRHEPNYDSIQTLRDGFDTALDQIAAQAEHSDLNTQRARILQWCRRAAGEQPGFFALNVPTGGGKTLAAMSFALRHVVQHYARGMRRVIVVVPYTTIIEQNAKVYRDVMGAHNVVEHHSNLDDFSKDEAKQENEESDEARIRRQLACENWDAPVIVTTNVQLFESLFTNKRGRARKLHNIAGSVIILDEAQSLPVDFLQLILTALRQLVGHFGCTVLVSTATQPAWKHRRSLPYGILEDQLFAIIPRDAKLSNVAAFDRVEIEWPENDTPLPYEGLAERLADEPCVMAIVHRKKDAHWLARRLKKLRPDQRLFHLSTNMCPVHRRRVLASVKDALKEYRRHGTPCRIVSTQLVEAGVDIDIPVIYRAFAGLDSIAQAAGRCNRESQMDGRKGRVVVFFAETDPPDAHLKHCALVTKAMLSEHGDKLNIKDPAIFEEYFTRLYRDRKLDAKDLARHVRDLNFETLGREFRLIDDSQQISVAIPFDAEAQDRLRVVFHLAEVAPENGRAARWATRALQPYTVNIWPKGLATLRQAVEPLFPGSSAWKLNWPFFPGAYDEVFGLNVDDEPVPASARLVV